MNKIQVDFLIVGAGIIGLTLAYNLRKHFPKEKILIIDKEKDIAFHSSGRNSGVLHAGFYYYPDSLKAKFTRDGNERLTKYCEEKGLKINKCGKVVVARNEKQLETLFELKRRGDTNGVELYIINEKELKEIEPNAKTYKNAIWSPNTAVVDPIEVLNTIKKDLLNMDVSIEFNTKYENIIDENTIQTKDRIIEFKKLINTAGLYADKIAKDFGLCNSYTILPFKGVYLYYTGNDKPVRTNVYPVPNIKNPFLGVHFTVKVDGGIKIGPTAMPAFWRENYEGLSNFDIEEFINIFKWDAILFFKSSLFRRTAMEEIRKYIKHNIISDANGLVDNVGDKSKYVWGKPGIRAQLLDIYSLQLVHDFVVETGKTSVHILNAVSPAFTASFPFTEYIVESYILKEDLRNG